MAGFLIRVALHTKDRSRTAHVHDRQRAIRICHREEALGRDKGDP